jgi:hypothetical protein
MLDDDMQSLAQDIETSYDARQHETRERRKETQEFLAQVAVENQERAVAVRQKLLSYAAVRQRAQAVWDQLTRVMRAKRKG